MVYETVGLNKRKPREPVLIFEAGFGIGGSGSLGQLGPGLAGFSCGICYDRNGEGGSEEDSTIITDTDLARRLHELLATLHIAPPYMLIGHSMGGPYIRMFTGLYPKEVAGLLFIDPTDFMLTDQQDEQIRILSKSGHGARDWVVPYEDSLANDTLLSLRTRHRVKRLADLFRAGPFKEYVSLAPLPDIPVGVLIAYNQPRDSAGYNSGELARFALAKRYAIENFSAMIQNNHDSFIMLLPRYGHDIQGKDPELVIDAIRRVFAAAKKRNP